MIVTSAALRDPRPAAALTYVEIVCLTRSALLSVLPDWPVSQHNIHIAATTIAMGRAPCLIANYLAKHARSHGELNRALQNLGRASSPEDKEFHAVMKQINDSKPLRGFARELVQSKDAALARRAAASVLVAGDEGKLIVDEDGRACNKEGDAVEVVEDIEEPALKAVHELRTELRSETSALRAQLSELQQAQQQTHASVQQMMKLVQRVSASSGVRRRQQQPKQAGQPPDDVSA